MHEMSITQGIIDICESHAGGRRVLSVDVEIGELSSVVPSAVEFCFEACSLGTLMEGARINIIRIPGSGQCLDCAASTPLTALFGSCQHCGGYQVYGCVGRGDASQGDRGRRSMKGHYSNSRSRSYLRLRAFGSSSYVMVYIGRLNPRRLDFTLDLKREPETLPCSI